MPKDSIRRSSIKILLRYEITLRNLRKVWYLRFFKDLSLEWYKIFILNISNLTYIFLLPSKKSISTEFLVHLSYLKIANTNFPRHKNSLSFCFRKDLLKKTKEKGEKGIKRYRSILHASSPRITGTKRMNNKEDSCFVKVSKHLSRPGVNKRRRVKKVFRSSCAAHVAPGVTRVPPVCKYARVRWAEQPACARFVELYLKRFEPVKLSLSLPGHPFPPRATSSPSP